jgi:AraC-like DNA-binding protein
MNILKDYFFPVDNIKILVSKGKYSPCLTSNQHVHTYWEVKVFPNGNETTDLALIALVPPNVIHDSTPNIFSEKTNFVLGFMQPRISLQVSTGEYFCHFSQLDELCPGGIINVLCKIEALLKRGIGKNLLEKLLNDFIHLLFSTVNIAFESDADLGFSLTERACDYIERQYYYGDLTVEKIAEHLEVTPGHLANLFKKESLDTVRQYLIKTRLKHAARLLSSGRYTVKDVTELTGWNSQFYFSNCFKKHYKISPSAMPLQPDTEIIKTRDV